MLDLHQPGLFGVLDDLAAFFIIYCSVPLLIVCAAYCLWLLWQLIKGER